MEQIIPLSQSITKDFCRAAEKPLGLQTPFFYRGIADILILQYKKEEMQNELHSVMILNAGKMEWNAFVEGTDYPIISVHQ